MHHQLALIIQLHGLAVSKGLTSQTFVNTVIDNETSPRLAKTHTYNPSTRPSFESRVSLQSKDLLEFHKLIGFVLRKFFYPSHVALTPVRTIEEMSFLCFLRWFWLFRVLESFQTFIGLYIIFITVSFRERERDNSPNVKKTILLPLKSEKVQNKSCKPKDKGSIRSQFCAILNIHSNCYILHACLKVQLAAGRAAGTEQKFRHLKAGQPKGICSACLCL